MRVERRLGLGLALTLLVACASAPPLPAVPLALEAPLQLLVSQQGETPRDWLLVIRPEPGALHWTLLDPLGMPVARQRLAGDRWQADGRLPPATAARELFAALLFALTPPSQLAAAYPHAREAGDLRELPGPGWRVRRQAAQRLDLDMGGGLSYRVAPLADGAALP